MIVVKETEEGEEYEKRIADHRCNDSVIKYISCVKYSRGVFLRKGESSRHKLPDQCFEHDFRRMEMASHGGTGAKIRQGYLIGQDIPHPGRLLGICQRPERILASWNARSSVGALPTECPGTAESWDTHRDRYVQRARMHAPHQRGQGTLYESAYLFRVIVAVSMMVMIVMRFPRMGIMDT